MNAETINLIERPYQEIVDDILTAVVGGVVNEPIIFDVKSVLYALAQPAQAVRGITGTIQIPEKREPVHHTFQKEIDFLFNPDRNAVVWQDGGKRPKDETTFYVDYFLPVSRSPLNDINVGSVTRTLSEAIGREIATVYQQINLAYLSGFIDTATGKSLDFVVSILDVTRKTKDFAVGLATFFRDPLIEGNITIQQGTEIATSKGEVLFETTEPRTLQRGQARIDVPIRAAEKFKGELGKVEPGKITTLSQLIAGISRVTNFEPTFLAAEDETDEELRLRAKVKLRGVSKATIEALRLAVVENRATLDEISDPNTPAKQTSPGTVAMLVQTEPGRFPSLQAAVNDVRAAGVRVTIAARFVFVKPKIVARITPGITAEGKSKIAADIIAAQREFLEGLKAGEQAKGTDLIGVIKKVKDVVEVTIVDVRTSLADIGEPGANALVEALVAEVASVNAADTDALRVAITQVVDSGGLGLVPSGRREPKRDLVQGLDKGRGSGSRASDGEISAGKFVLVPPEKFSLVLDMEPADIVLQES